MTDTTEFENMVRIGWADASIANGYADAFDTATRQSAQALAEHVSAGPGQAILDVCTGHGVVASELISRGANVTGLDFSPAMISLATESVPGAVFIEGDAMNMPFGDESFDAATAGFGIPHLPDTRKGLAEVARVLKPGGRLAISFWRGKDSEGAMGWLFDAVGRLGDASVKLPTGPDAHAMCDPDLARLELEPAGFIQVETHDIATELYLSSPEDLFDVFRKGSVRAASLLASQPQDKKKAIKDDLAARARQFGEPDGKGIRVPNPSVAVVARRAN